jgi:hypothetical protein
VIKSDQASAAVKQSLSGYLPTVKQQHDILRDCKWAMEARKSAH